MSQYADNSCEDPTKLNQQQQKQQHPPSEKVINTSEIEKLYLRIKEDWL